jgi:hypothetical protein
VWHQHGSEWENREDCRGKARDHTQVQTRFLESRARSQR